MRPDKTDKAATMPELDRPTPTARIDDPDAWQMIEAGRYQPRRIRGSFRGRELG